MSETNIPDLILHELREFRKETNDKLDSHGNRISVVETKIDPLFDNGQRGIITKIQDDIDDLNRSKYYFIGALAALEGVGHWIGKKLGL